jgi:hypothetical protein
MVNLALVIPARDDKGKSGVWNLCHRLLDITELAVTLFTGRVAAVFAIIGKDRGGTNSDH